MTEIAQPEHVHDLPHAVPDDGRAHLLSVVHPLHTMDVQVYCYDDTGRALGFLLSSAIDNDVVDVAAPPGCARIVIRRAEA